MSQSLCRTLFIMVVIIKELAWKIKFNNILIIVNKLDEIRPMSISKRLVTASVLTYTLLQEFTSTDCQRSLLSIKIVYEQILKTLLHPSN